ncbi:MAG: NADP-dependent malic enzyme [Bacteroidales bacterium]|nr:NADP-dependent malic enzyme [Bacteroidales bacterium]MDD2571323.1 NADP-dependent malic enzyme [Bacteroidales bacterium]MDD2812341.1 NADP-dependent malic enzyme [Bacteroidales bacterium]MDD3811621.1 NADP-dependent malic enzyme [Bacteroidales bacterium]MDD3870849.1 NADP-dependent malic enzyme [Bacteroidales bacterium]
MATIKKEQALDYHSKGRPGKIEVIPTVPYSTQYDLSLAYTPGVAIPCKEIEANPEDAYKYTAKGNLVAVVSNGTAVLGLGDIGPLAGKPVMEGKGLLFKVFADVDVFDIEVNEKDPEKLIQVVKAIAPTFGGINLEDIKAPECFEIEQQLIQELDIPVFHDDQHGTAIISLAGLLNASELVGKKIEDLIVVVNGAGAAAVSCIRLYISMGVRKENVIMVDSKGVLNRKRKDLNPIKMQFVTDREVDTLAEAMVGADVFLGLSVADVVTPDMLKSMADHPIVFAMANPNPEISYEEAVSSRDDLIFATGRSDYPNQINNVLGFPFIFRGALDVRASRINEEMKIAAAKALAQLAREDVPEAVNLAYNIQNLHFGKEYIIPKPLDPRLITTIAPAVARAAMESGVARQPITDWEDYHRQLLKRMGLDNQLIRHITDRAKRNPKRVLFGQAENTKVLKAVQAVKHEGIAYPIVMGNAMRIRRMVAELELDLDDLMIVDPRSDEELHTRELFAAEFVKNRNRKGITYDEAMELMMNQSYFGSMMVHLGKADAFLSGTSSKFSYTIKPAIEVVGRKKMCDHIAGMYILMTKRGPFFFADTAVNKEPDVQTLIETTVLAAEQIKRFGIVPKIALLSYSNFGSQRQGSPAVVAQAVKVLHEHYPDLIVDGEMQANFALNKELRLKKFPFSKLTGHDVNTLIFPNLDSGNIAYKMIQEIGGAEVIGPVIMGMNRPIHILQMESNVREIIYLASIAVIDAQNSSDQ